MPEDLREELEEALEGADMSSLESSGTQDESATGVAGAPAGEEAADSSESSGDSASQESGQEGQEGQEWVGIRKAAEAAGYDLSKYEDDGEAFKHLLDQAKAAEETGRTAQQWQEVAQRLYQESQRQSTEAPTPAQEQDAPKPLWNPPEWNQNWLTQVERDESGNLVPTNGGTMDTVAKVQTYLQHRQDEQDRFWQDPYKYMEPYVERRIEDAISKGGKDIRAGWQEEYEAKQFIKDNGEWLFEGNSGALSEEGRIFQQAVNGAAERGYSQDDQRSLGMQQIEMHRMRQRVAELEQGPSAKAKGSREEMLKKEAGFVPNHTGTEARTPDAEGDVPPQNPNATLAEQLAAELRAAGINDSDLQDF